MKITPPVVAVSFGDSFSANCSTTETGVAGMGWEATHGGTDLKEGVSSIPFQLDKVKEWKINDPICYVSLSNGEQIFDTLQVIVYSK